MGSRWSPRGGWQYFPPSVPREARGGIKARSKRGAIGSTWWGKRWIEVLEGFGWSNRLRRGRRYARLGQVLDFRLAPGVVEAKVQGSRPKAYRVRIALRPLAEPLWARVSEELTKRSGLTAELLSGEMPEGVEEIFRSAHASLFPEKDEDFEADCSCPDWANPCKHIAAVHYILGEAFDRDPFLLFALRGRPKDRLLAGLRAHRAGVPLAPPSRAGAPPATPPPATPPESGRVPLSVPPPPVPLPTAPQDFWGGAEGVAKLPVAVRPPKVPDAVLRRLGDPAFLRGSPRALEALRKAYSIVGQRAISQALGPAEPSSSAPTMGGDHGPEALPDPRKGGSGALKAPPRRRQRADLPASSLSLSAVSPRKRTRADRHGPVPEAGR